MKVFGKISAAIVLMVYVAAFVGFRLHECSVDHTVKVLLLAGDSCEEVHHHHCTDAASCGHHHHHCAEEHENQDAPESGLQLSETDCCANSLHCLSEAQLASDGSTDEFGQRDLALSSLVIAECCPSVVSGECSTISFCEARCPLPGHAVLALYSVRRV